MEEKERRSQTIIVGFGFFLTTRPALVKFEVEGTATLSGKDDEMRKMLEVDPDTKMPSLLQRVYPPAFTAMYLLSSVLNVPAPPQDLLYSRQQGSADGVTVEVGTAPVESQEPVATPVETEKTEKSEAAPAGK